MVGQNSPEERLAALETESKNHTKMLEKIDKKIDRQDYVPRQEIDQRFEAQGREIHGIKVNNRWAWGIVFAAIIGIGGALLKIFA